MINYNDYSEWCKNYVFLISQQLKPLCFTARSDANKVFNGVLDGVRCRQTEEMYAKDWTQASPSAASDQEPLTAVSAECSASASG